INVTANDSASGRAWIVKNWVDPRRIRRRCGRRRRRRVSRILNESFAISPTIIFATAGIGRLLNINLLARVLSDIADKHPTVCAVETVAVRIAQTEQPD